MAIIKAINSVKDRKEEIEGGFPFLTHLISLLENDHYSWVCVISVGYHTV